MKKALADNITQECDENKGMDRCEPKLEDTL